jgi:tetratricopeptide (TPR) repeat protein
VSALANNGEQQAAEERITAFLERIGRDPAFDALFAMKAHLVHSDVLADRFRFDEAARALERAEEAARLHPPKPESMLVLRKAKAFLALAQGRLDEARVVLEELVGEQKDLLARADPGALEAVNLLGMVSIQQGRLEEAEALFLDLCVDAERSLDPDHPMVVVFRVNLARVWEAQGRVAEAEELFRELVTQLEAKYGPMDTNVLMNRNNVAACLLRQGRTEEAEAIFRDVWEKHRTAVGESDDRTLFCQHNLAQTLVLLGRAEEALPLQEQVVALTPDDHPQAAARRNQLESIRARTARR